MGALGDAVDADRDVVVAHEHYPARGGGEVVADALADVFDTEIVTGWISDPSHSEHEPIEILERTPADPLRRFFGNPLVRDTFYMFAWESVPTLRDYDVVIQSGNAPTWYVPEQHQTIVKYNHSPPRNPFDLFWRDGQHTAEWRDLLSPGYVVDRLYKKAARHLWKNRTDEVDLWVCNSEIVAHRTRKYLGVPEEKIRVVYPPVPVDEFGAQDGGDYYLSFGRLEPSKHTLTTIEAFEQLNQHDGEFRLVVAGTGNEHATVERKAAEHDWLTYEGFVSDERKRELYAHAKALVFLAENEDFGMVPIEAMAAGTPVIGVAEGFTEHQIFGGENGHICYRNPASVSATVRHHEQVGVEWSANQLHEFAQQFSPERFAREMREMVALARERNEIAADLNEPMPEVRQS